VPFIITAPGEIALARAPCGPNSAAQARVSAGGRLCLSGLEPSLTDYLDAQAWLVKGRGG
jgi:hypothetical protein